MKKYGVSYLKRTRGVHMLLWYTTCMRGNQEEAAERNGGTKLSDKRIIVISRTKASKSTIEHTKLLRERRFPNQYKQPSKPKHTTATAKSTKKTHAQ